MEMSKIRIFMVGLSNNKGGVESYIINLCEHLHSKEFEVVYDWPEIYCGRYDLRCGERVIWGAQCDRGNL